MSERRIPCAIADCNESARPENVLRVKAPTMPAPAFYYYCDEHAAKKLPAAQPGKDGTA